MLARLNKHFSIPWFIFLTVLAGTFGYYKAFTGFSSWDDEGSLMISVQQYIQGHRLYADVPTPYGPIYYFYNHAIRTLTDTPVTHDNTRLGAIALLLVAPLICAWFVLRLTRSLAAASIVHICTVLFMLEFIGSEPGHPQEITIVLVACFIAASDLVSRKRWHAFSIFLLGAIAAALSLVKVNIGIFVVLGGALALLFHMPRTKLTRGALLTASLATVTLPLLLMKNHLHEHKEQALCAVITLSIIALLLRLGSLSLDPSISYADAGLASTGYITIFAAVLLSLKLKGIALFAVFDSLVLFSRRVYVVSSAFYVLPEVRRAWSIVAVAGVAVVFILWRIERSSSARMRDASSLFSVVKFIWGTAALAISFLATPLGFIPPFSWLAITPPRDNVERSQSFPRTLLCAVAILATLYVYPVAGSQRYFVAIPLILVASLCIGDGLAVARYSPRIWRNYLPWATAAILALVALCYMTLISKSRREYHSLSSLALPGAQRVHLDAQQALDYQWLTRNIKSYCDVFFGLPNLPSMHFWTGIPPITNMTWDAWILFATPEQQRLIETKLDEHKDACVVYNPDLVKFWDRHGTLDVDALPLVQYIHAEYLPVIEKDNYHLLVRKDRLRTDGGLERLSGNRM